MAAECCFIAYTLCTPAGAPIIGFLNAETNAYETYLNADGSPFTGDPSTLVPCGGAAAGSTSSLTQVDNGDGTITVSHDPGDGSAPVSFTACASCTTAVDNNDGTATITNPDGTTVTVCAGCTEIVDNGDGTYTATNPDGTTVTWGGGSGNTSVLTDNGDGTWTHDDGTGTTVTISTGSVVDNGDGTATVTFPDGTTATVCTDCGHASAVANPDGSVTIINPDGTTVTIPAETVTSLVVGADGSATYTSEDGTVTVVPGETITSFVDNGDGTFTYTSEDGTVTTTPPPGAETTTTLVNNSDGTWTYTSENGTTTTVSTGGVIDNGDGTATVTFPDGSTAIVCTDCQHAVAAANPDGTVTITNPDGTTVTTTASTETVTTFTDNGDGTYTYTSEDGTVTTTATPGAETVTTLVDNGDGTYTYTSENGSVTTFNAGGNTSSVTLNGDGTVTHDDGTGSTAVIDVCALVVEGGCLPTVTPGPGTHEYTFNDGHGNTTVIAVNELDADISDVSITGSVVTFTAEDGSTVVIDICAVIAANCNATLVVNADGSMVHTANDGTVTNVPAPPAASQLVLNPDGSFTHTAGGVVTSISVCDLNSGLTGTGDPIPADGSVSILGDDCQWHGIPGHTEVYVEGDTLTYDVTLPDGSTLTAGTPVPPGVVIIAEENVDGTLIDASALGLGEFDYCQHVQSLPTRPVGVNIAARLIVGDDGNCYADTGCGDVEGPNGVFGEQSGAFIDACDVQDLAGTVDPETLFPAAGYPEWWRQPFINGLTGTEFYIIQLDTNGVKQWHQVS